MGTLIQFPAPRSRTEIEAGGAELDSAVLWAPLVVVWLAGVARVALAIVHEDVFDAEATLAFAYLIALPLVGLRSWLQQRRPRQLG